MKTTLKLLPLLLTAVLMTACENYGKRVTIDGTKGEVYYKGKGVAESDAKKVGDYLKGISFFSNEKAATVQVTKQEDAYTVRFVYDKNYFEQNASTESSFKQIGYDMSQKVFSGSKVNIALADSTMNDFKTIPYDASVAQSATSSSGSSTASTTTTGNTTSSLGNSNNSSSGDNNSSNLGPATNSLAGYNHETIGNITFYWKDISADDEKVISSYVVKNGSFAANHEVDIITNKEGNRYIVRFPVGDSYNDTDPTLQQALEKVAHDIKDNVFSNQQYSFIVTNTKLDNLKSWEF